MYFKFLRLLLIATEEQNMTEPQSGEAPASKDDKSGIKEKAQIEAGREVLINDIFSDRAFSPRAAAGAKDIEAADKVSRESFAEARQKIKAQPTYSVKEDLKKIGMPEILYGYLQQGEMFERFDSNNDKRIGLEEVKARAGDPLVVKTDVDKVLMPILEEYARQSGYQGITRDGLALAVSQHTEFAERDKQEAQRSKGNLELAQRIIKVFPTEAEFNQLDVNKKDGVTDEDLKTIIESKAFQSAPKERKQAILDLRAHLPEIVRDYKGKGSAVKFSDLEDFVKRNTPGKISYSANAVSEALTANNNQLFDLLTKSDLGKGNNERSQEFVPVDQRVLSKERVQALLREANEGSLVDNWNLRPILEHIEKNSDQIKGASKSGGDNFSLADFKAYPAIALEARRLEDLGRRLDANADSIFGNKNEISKHNLEMQLAITETANKVLTALKLEQLPDRTREQLLTDVLANWETMANSGEQPSRFGGGVLTRGEVQVFRSRYADSQNDRMEPVVLHLPERTTRAYGGDEEPVQTVVVNEGKSNEAVYRQHVNGDWYHYPKGGEAVKMAKGFHYDRNSKTISYDSP